MRTAFGSALPARRFCALNERVCSEMFVSLWATWEMNRRGPRYSAALKIPSRSWPNTLNGQLSGSNLGKKISRPSLKAAENLLASEFLLDRRVNENGESTPHLYR